MLRNESNPSASRWSDAHAYLETVTQRSNEQLLADYRSFPDAEDEALRDNAVLKRSIAIDTIAERSELGEIVDVPGLATGLLQTLGSESEPVIRMATVDALQALAKHTSSNDRQQIIIGLERHLSVESDPYFAKPTVEQAIEDLRKTP